MPRSSSIQTSFLSGVLDPRAKGRSDTDAYANGLLRGINIEPIHLGGVRRRRGLKYRMTMPNQLTRVTGGTFTAPEGGTAANANDDTETTVLTTVNSISTTNPYVVAHYDLGTARAVVFADVVALSISAGTSTQFAIQYSTDNVSWTTLGSALTTVSTTVRSYRRASTATARYWRVARVGATDLSTAVAELGDFNLWLDSGTVSAGRLIPFEVSADDRYAVILTDRSITVYGSGAVVDRQPSPYTSANLADIDASATEDLLAVVHGSYPPRFLSRETSTNFQCYPIDFTAIPQIDFADSSSPTPTSDVQTLVFTNFVEGNTFQLALDGARTGIISFAGDVSQTADNIALAVQKLWSVHSYTGVSCARSGANTFVLTLASGAADAYGRMTGTPLTAGSTAAIAVTHTTTGVPRFEDVWSATRGYPRTVTFYEGRLYFGGLQSKQQSLVGSRVNDILGFDLAEGLEDDPVFVTLTGSRLNAIQGLFAGRSLQMFTTGEELRYVKDSGSPITPGDAPVSQTQYGSAKIRPVSIDGATIFVHRNRKSIRDFRFDYVENAYNSLGISSLAPHLVYDVRDIAAWHGSSSDELNLLLVVNGTNPDTSDEAFADGTLAIFNSRKESQVQAWVIWTTDGKFKAVCTVLEDMYFLVQRNINGTEYLFLEQGDINYYLDSAVQVTNSPASTTVTGLSHLNGEACRVRADGYVLDNVTPSAGSATISRSSSAVEVGLDWTVDVTPMPIQTITTQGTNAMRKRRIVKVRARLRNTLGILVNGRRIPDRAFDIDSLDAAADPFTGIRALEESTNWDQEVDKTVSITQVDPLPFELLAIDVQVEGEG